jgi:hypothetical protein
VCKRVSCRYGMNTSQIRILFDTDVSVSYNNEVVRIVRSFKTTERLVRRMFPSSAVSFLCLTKSAAGLETEIGTPRHSACYLFFKNQIIRTISFSKCTHWYVTHVSPRKQSQSSVS